MFNIKKRYSPKITATVKLSSITAKLQLQVLAISFLAGRCPAAPDGHSPRPSATSSTVFRRAGHKTSMSIGAQQIVDYSWRLCFYYKVWWDIFLKISIMIKTTLSSNSTSALFYCNNIMIKLWSVTQICIKKTPDLLMKFS